MFSLVRRLRARRLRGVIEEQREFYTALWTPEEIRIWQLRQFNRLWLSIWQRVPFYTTLVREGKAPKQFASWEEFRSTVPITDRTLVQQRGGDLSDASRVGDFTRTTGGTTSQPVKLPAWRSELAYANSDLWFARDWFDIAPSDKLFLFWGHSHQLGSGVRGKLNAWRRELKDALLGYCRFSAYDLSAEALRRAGDALLKLKPAYVIAYSVALDRFAHANADRASEFSKLGLKAAIATAEAFPRRNSAAFISQVLGCRVAMEYGSVECGPVAHQREDGHFLVFWQHWFIEGEPSTHVQGAFEILLTSLYPRCFPLVRYRIGDLISEDPNAAGFNQTFGRLIGRCNDCIALPDGGTIHSEAFTHAVKECRFVLGFQVVQNVGGAIRFHYISSANDATNEAEIRQRLAKIHPNLRDIELKHVASLPQTIAGKTRSIVREAVDAH